MRANQQHAKGNKKAGPLWSGMEEHLNKLVHLLKDAEFKDLLDECKEEFAAAEPTTELTDNDLEAIEEAKAADQLQRRCEYVRNVFKAIIKIKSDNPNSELYRVAKKGLELLDEIEAGNNHLWRELDTVTYTFVQLLQAESKKPSKRRRILTCIKRIPRWIYGLLVAILVAVIAAVAVDIFADFGWLESIKGLIYKMLPAK